MNDILIITAGPLCRNPRAAKEARTLADNGWQVTVLAAGGAERFEQQDRMFLSDTGIRKLMVQDLTKRDLSWHANRLATWLARRAARAGIGHPQALGPYFAYRQAVRGIRARLTIVHTEIGLAIGQRLQRTGVRVAADIEDWHSRDLLPKAQRYRPLGLLRNLERHHLRTAVYTTTTSEALADALYTAYGGRRPIVLRNVFPLSPATSLRPPAEPPSLVWFSQTVGPGRGLEPFLDGWSRTQRPSNIVLVGNVDPGYCEALRARVAPERRGNVHFEPAVPAHVLPTVLRRHHLGLALELPTPPSRDLTITNKCFQYLDAGLGVLATPTSGQRELMADIPEACLRIEMEDPTTMAKKLDALLSKPRRIEAMGIAARMAAERRYCWELESRTLLDAVATVTHV